MAGKAGTKSRNLARGKTGTVRGARPKQSAELFTKDRVVTALRCAEKGMTDTQVAEILGITGVMFDRWKQRYPDFRDALKGAKDVADRMVVDSLFTRAIGYSYVSEKIFMTKEGDIVRAETVEHAIPDTQACMFWLKNRQPDLWREKQHVHLAGAVAGAATKIIDDVGDITQASDEMLARVYADAVNLQTLDKVASEMPTPPMSGSRH